MNKEILYLVVRAEVNSNLGNIPEIIQELEKEAVIVLSDTTNIQVLNTHILFTRFNSPKHDNNGTSN
ncbi:hypothetical protein [Pedobacter puniceum]|uniref:Uncharacterized protein n=1 Tax=Pedobacter puniceum TaxID=2666136 RepID=A0A7K0FLV1_9SPHI|nr:hypothetical protein [Pedobacter puniceum]MRX46946.1 hypothetical protein [Pedobacter puniceum]